MISVSSLFFSSAKQDTMTHKTPLITASGHKGWDLRHPLITASQRMALDWLSFSLEAKCMDRIRRYVKLCRSGTVIKSALSNANYCESRWFWHWIKYISLFRLKTIGHERDSFQINFLPGMDDKIGTGTWFSPPKNIYSGACAFLTAGVLASPQIQLTYHAWHLFLCKPLISWLLFQSL